MQRRQALKALGGGLAGLCLPGLCLSGTGAVACGGYPAAGSWQFRVLRHGDEIGAHIFTFSGQGDDFVVRVAIDIVVSLLGIPVFRFTHRAEETWRDGLMQALTCDTDDDGTPWQVRYWREGGRLRGSVNGGPADAPEDILPASLWHPDTRRAHRLLDTVDGLVKPVEPRFVAADRFRLTGGLVREVWTDADCGLSRVDFPARDGSLITLQRV